jgi:hypothetical protein
MADSTGSQSTRDIVLSGKRRRLGEVVNRILRADKINYLKQKFPRSDFESTSEWAQAVIDEINSVLIPDSVSDTQPSADLVAVSRSAATFSGDLFKQELALDGRLCALV